MPDHAILSADAHRDLRIRLDHGAALGDAVMACLTVPDEFRRVQNEYPILFRLDQAQQDFTALALFGFESGENLFLDGDRWDARYRPLAMAIQPFLVGRGGPDDAGQVHVDTASPRIATDGSGVRLFDEDARPTPFLETAIAQLQALDEGHRAMPGFVAALRRHDLLEPLTLEIALDDGSTNRLVGFHVIDEEQLQSLDPAALADLGRDGHLMPIFMALASLANIGELVRRRNARGPHG